jgi:hypothetical protein
MIIKVTSPQAPQVLPVTDAEISRVAYQTGSEQVTVSPAARPSGCLVAVLIVVGILLFFGGGIYGVYHPVCPNGELIKDFPVAGLPAFVPHCLNGDVLSDPEQEYIYPGAAILSPIAEWGGVALDLWGCILPIVRSYRGRAEREKVRAQKAVVASQQSIQQQAIAVQIGKARERVSQAYYCGRDDGFFIPGHAQFFPRTDWRYFLFG